MHIKIKNLLLFFTTILIVGCSYLFILDNNVFASPDPTTVGTSTSNLALKGTFQRKTFYAQGRYWMFWYDGSDLVYSSSADGTNWESETYVANIEESSETGNRFSVWTDEIYVFYARAQSTAWGAEPVYFRKGLLNSDGTINWEIEREAVPAVTTINYYLTNDSTGISNIWVMDTTNSSPSTDETTEIVTGTTAIDNYFYVDPFQSTTTPFGTSLPGTITLKGWRTDPISVSEWRKEGRHRAYYKLKNRIAASHAGRLYARVWKSSNADMSSAVAITNWVSTGIISFSATAGETKTGYINFYLDSSLDNEYMYIEFVWRVTTASGDPATGIYFVADETDERVYSPAFVNLNPFISLSSNGYPFITFMRYDFSYVRMYVVRAASLNGSTWTTPASLSTSFSGWEQTASVIPLTSGKMIAIYSRSGYTVRSKLWNTTAWESEEAATTSTIQTGYTDGVSVVGEGDDIHLVFLTSGNDVKYIKRTYGSGWGSEVTVQSSATSTSAPALSINTANNDLYVFWAGSPTTDHVYYKKNVAGTWDNNPTDWIDEETDNLTRNDSLASFYKDYAHKIGLAYMTKTASPYNVRFDYLNVNQSSNPPSSLAPTNYVNGSWISDKTPTLQFTQSDPDTSDTLRYRIQIDNNSDFSSPVIDYTSDYISQGATSFTVGQAPGTGSYTQGSQGQTLTNGSYYWQVMSEDNYGGTSSWTQANSGNIAFKLSIAKIYKGVTNTIYPSGTVSYSQQPDPDDLVSLYITPSYGSVDVTILIWRTSGDYYKKWLENASSSGIVTDHTVGDLKPNTSYNILVDNTIFTQKTSDDQGEINFTYDGGYSEKTFEIEQAPEQEELAPTGYNISSLLYLLSIIFIILGFSLYKSF